MIVLRSGWRFIGRRPAPLCEIVGEARRAREIATQFLAAATVLSGLLRDLGVDSRLP